MGNDFFFLNYEKYSTGNFRIQFHSKENSKKKRQENNFIRKIHIAAYFLLITKQQLQIRNENAGKKRTFLMLNAMCLELNLSKLS